MSLMLPLLVSIGLTLFMWGLFGLDILLSWLIAINLITFLTYGVDKMQARRDGWRISERNLLILAIIGGSIGALIGMQVFGHKTRKSSFRGRYWLVVLVQIILIVLYFIIIK